MLLFSLTKSNMLPLSILIANRQLVLKPQPFLLKFLSQLADSAFGNAELPGNIAGAFAASQLQCRTAMGRVAQATSGGMNS